MTRTIEINQSVTVSQLASQLDLPVNNLVAELFKNGIVATLNEKIDFETASILIEELGLDVVVRPRSVPELAPAISKLNDRVNPDYKNRPPIVAVMGHVDHGKTSLVDKICQTNIQTAESGGITQRIRAQQADHNGRLITFLDTPGHAAFAAIRQHGAILTDLVLIVVAADDGVGEQTVEAIRFAQKTGSRIIVVASKMDRPGANIERLKTQLTEHGLLLEGRGGEISCIPVSVVDGQGLEQLLDMILLIADTDNLQSDARGPATGRVIDAHQQKGLGFVANVLIEAGRLRRGDFFTVGSTWGRVRTLQTPTGEPLKIATASTPVVISGLKDLPEFGDSLYEVGSEKQAKRLALDQRQSSGVRVSGMTNRELLRIIKRHNQSNYHNLLIKTDVKGSLATLVDSVKVFDNEEVSPRVVGSGVGPVSENDIWLAKNSQATIYCFKTKTPPPILKLAQTNQIIINHYQVIYEFLDDVRAALERLLPPESKTVELGQLQVVEVFKTTRTNLICGGRVVRGQLSQPAQVRVIRGGTELAQANLRSLKKAAIEVSAVNQGEMCGVSLSTKSRLNLKPDDSLAFYRDETIPRSLDSVLKVNPDQPPKSAAKDRFGAGSKPE